jgi:hypothetical protein
MKLELLKEHQQAANEIPVAKSLIKSSVKIQNRVILAEPIPIEVFV